MRTLHNLPLLCATLILATIAPEQARVETVKYGNCSDQALAAKHERPAGSRSSRSTAGRLSTHVQAGNGRVSAGSQIGRAPDVSSEATGSDGDQDVRARRSVTVTSSSGSSASSSVSSSSSGSGTATASGSGDCVIISD